ncbi:adenylosuccinate lyase [Thermocrinis minervae]|uniref:Adenylosuccinate lyase n=1 Tax=Thermocrinis minervae TaxID=381751 RepID=A0A1M6TCF4_9AQUI|nr:adenylosuccinate lyase [Thermocrinis minervae]SHK54458.1 adenylosuccinate lyase [Thermocrinis minervae]
MVKRYTRPQMGEIWSDLSKFRFWLEVEKAICRAWHKLGKIPAQALEKIEKTYVDEEVLRRIEEYEKVYNHDVLAFVSAIGDQIRGYTQYFHMGITSSDIVDTALALQIREALRLILQDVDLVLEELKRLSLEHKHTLMMGRTHGMHAEPITLGLKFLVWYDEMKRNRQRLLEALDNISYGKIAGAVGTYSNLDPMVEKLALEELGLKPEPASTQIVHRDRHAQVVFSLAICATSLEKFATEIRHLQRTEVGEVEEPFREGQRGSSAMPHKKNPIHAERICGLARVIRSNLTASLENVVLWHERDISHSSAERVILPDSFIALDYILNLFLSILKGLKVNKDRMLKNMDLSFGLYASSKILTLLMEKGIDRDIAYQLVQRCAMRSYREEIPFRQSLMEDTEVSKYLTQEEIEKAIDPKSFLKHLDYIYDKVFGGDKDGSDV